MSAITTHILDVSLGTPASGVLVLLERQISAETWQIIGKGVTDADGRISNLISADENFLSGNYRITFETGTYFVQQQIDGFYPQVTVAFTVRDTTQHYHVPLLLSPFGYSTYRGS